MKEVAMKIWVAFKILVFGSMALSWIVFLITPREELIGNVGRFIALNIALSIMLIFGVIVDYAIKEFKTESSK